MQVVSYQGNEENDWLLRSWTS